MHSSSLYMVDGILGSACIRVGARRTLWSWWTCSSNLQFRTLPRRLNVYPTKAIIYWFLFAAHTPLFYSYGIHCSPAYSSNRPINSVVIVESDTNYSLFNFSYFHHQAAIIYKNWGPTTVFILQGYLFLSIWKISYPRRAQIYINRDPTPATVINTPWWDPSVFYHYCVADGNSRSDRPIDPAKTSCFPLTNPFQCYTKHWRDRDILSRLIKFRNSPKWFSLSTFSASLLTFPFILHHGISSRSDCHVYFLRRRLLLVIKRDCYLFHFCLVYVLRHSDGSYGIPYTLYKVKVWNGRTDSPYTFL